MSEGIIRDSRNRHERRKSEKLEKKWKKEKVKYLIKKSEEKKNAIKKGKI